MRFDLIVVGAGPAGLTAAITAARTKKKVLVLDRASRPGAKLLLAGGGKGNVTNRRVAHTDYIGKNPAFARNVLTRLAPEAVCEDLERAGILLEERDHGRVFCRTSAKAILDLLLNRLSENTGRLVTEAAVDGVTMCDGTFSVSTSKGSFHAPRLIAATGGPAWPQCGADDSGLRLARSLGHRIVPPRPILVPLIMPPAWPMAGLAGVSLPVLIACGDSPVFDDDLLFTHKGISGPAALRVSAYWRKDLPLSINFLPACDVESLLDAAKGKATPQSVLSRLLPDRLAAVLPDKELATRRVAEISRGQRIALAQAVHNHTVTPLRTEGFAKAEASAGGVETAEVTPSTLESRIVPGLFFCGEILDIAGDLGGYNLHWAWSSGFVAGEAAGKH